MDYKHGMCCHLVARIALVLLALPFILYAGPSTSAEQSSLQHLHAKAVEASLETSSYWRSLVHYYPSRRIEGATESHVDDDRFFLAPNGKHSPRAELLASISVLLGHVASPEKHDAQCRFVAREKWLRKSLDLPDAQPPATCNEYLQWRKNVGRGSVTLVFPASYLNSPSSMFGHTLLRIDPEDIESNSPLLSWSLNFAADVGGDSVSAGYAFKGLAGGYPGKFTALPYFEKLQEYGAIENRDIWEYRLDLNPDEIDRMLDHAWELRDISFDYFFFRENCSFRLLELMDLARPGLNLAGQFPITAIPADTVKAVSESGIVDKVDYRPSLGTRLNHAIESTPPTQRHWIDKIEAKPDVAESVAFKALDIGLQANVVRTANELLTFRSRRMSMTEATASRRLKLLTLVSQMPAETLPEVPLPSRPESAHETTTLSVAHGRDADQLYKEASLRFSYHDVLDRQQGYAQGAGIVLGDIRLRKPENDELRLESFDVVKLQSFNDRFSQLNSLSWELKVGLSRESIIEENRLGAAFDGSVGKSRRLGGSDLAYALLGASARQYVNPSSTFINAHLRFGWIGYHGFGASRIEVAANTFQMQSLQTTLSVKHNFPFAKNHALRLEALAARFAGAASERYSLAYRFYF